MVFDRLAVSFITSLSRSPNSLSQRRMREGSSIAATKASAVSWPTPGMVISRRQAAEALVIRLMSASIAATACDPAWKNDPMRRGIGVQD